MTSTKQPKRDPESAYYDSLKKQRVLASLVDGRHVDGTLEWVATYSLGVRPISGGDEPPPKVMLIMKGNMVTLVGL